MVSDILILSIAGLISGTLAIVLLYLAFRPRRPQKPAARPRVRVGWGQGEENPTVPSASEAPTEPPVVPAPLASVPGSEAVAVALPVESEAALEAIAPAGEQAPAEGDLGWDELLTKLERYKVENPESGISPASAYKKDGGRISKNQLKRLIRRLEESGSGEADVGNGSPEENT